MKNKKLLILCGVLLVVSMLFSACGKDDDEKYTPQPGDINADDLFGDDNDLSEDTDKLPGNTDEDTSKDTNSVGKEPDSVTLSSLEADFDGNGKKETIKITVAAEEDTNATVSVSDENGNVVWTKRFSELAGTETPMLCLCEIDGNEYLLLYTVSAEDSSAEYSYKIFKPTDGEDKAVYSAEASFNTSSGDKFSFDVDALAEFAEKLNEYLEHSILLVTLSDGEILYGNGTIKPQKEAFSFADEAGAGAEDIRGKLEAYL
ncbi:MAG: hypothetical protein ACI4QZ_05260, partial [Eubacteriales bacterium]